MELSKAFKLVQFFNSLAPSTMEVHHCLVLAYLAEHGPSTYREIEELLNTSNASASRTLTALSDQCNHRKTTFGLVERYRDPSEGRRYKVKLSAKGQAVFKVIESL